jgi:hypothetical protein
LNDSKAVKAYILNQGNSVIYESPKEINTHGLLRAMGINMLENDMNLLLKTKLRESFIMPKKYSKITTNPKPL